MADQDWQSDKTFSESNLHMLKSQLLADVTFLVGDQRETTLAHKFILVSRSCVFEAMFCGPMAEMNIVEIPDVESQIFEYFIRYIYSDDVILQPDTVLPLLYVAKKYSVKGLEKKCVEFCDSTLSPGNACTFLQQAYIFDEEPLKSRAMDTIAKHATTCLAGDGFKELGKDCLDLILESDDLSVDEIDVFKAAMAWAKAECERQERELTGEEMRNVLGKSLNLIRFPSIKQEKLADVVVPEMILTDSQLVQLFVRYTKPDTPIAEFNLKKRKNFVFTLIRSLNKREQTRSSDRKDALFMSCDKDVSLHAIYLYGGDIESTFKMMVDLKVSEKEEHLTEQTVEITVTKDKAMFRMPLEQPIVIGSGHNIHILVTCKGPTRYQCEMNRESVMIDETSGAKWSLATSVKSASSNSLHYGVICGFDYCLNP